MKILVVGDGHSEIHEVAVAATFRSLGHDVIEYHWSEQFKSGIPGVHHLLRFQNKYLLGPHVNKVNRDMIVRVHQEKPDLVFIYRGTHVFPITLKKIKQLSPTCILIGYNNDDPFSTQYPTWLWRHYHACIPEYDIVFAYREKNINELKRAGARCVDLLRSWYLPEINRPIEMTVEDQRRYACDVVFVGHYENDFRLDCLELIAKRNIHLRIFGHDYGWHPVIKRSPYLSRFLPLQTVWGEEYNKAICGAKIALCFLSKLNRDTYTRRCFEIPAARTLLLSEYSENLANLFVEGEEADFFKSPEEMLKKIIFYLENDKRRNEVANAGYQRVHKEGHDIQSRMQCVLERVRQVKVH